MESVTDLTQQEYIPANMVSAVEWISSLKADLDRYCRYDLGDDFVGDVVHANLTCSMDPYKFLSRIIPFLWLAPKERVTYPAYVSPFRVIGASIHGYPEDIHENEVNERIRKYSECFSSDNLSCYIYFKPLGFIVAHEGKNRVAFMRKHQQPKLAVNISEYDYPDPERIQLVLGETAHETWAVLDGKIVQKVMLPRLTTRIMRDYGVRTVEWRDIFQAYGYGLIGNETGEVYEMPWPLGVGGFYESAKSLWTGLSSEKLFFLLLEQSFEEKDNSGNPKSIVELERVFERAKKISAYHEKQLKKSRWEALKEVFLGSYPKW
ncbi:hypothetical protein [Neisseria sp. S1]|uniref:hypothetical protein n=1 Tax=Neisseria sp. S1 TaxID=3318354 RepID=UPI003A87D543